jgi:hypothetical protein
VVPQEARVATAFTAPRFPENSYLEFLRIRRTSIKVSALVTAITEPTMNIKISIVPIIEHPDTSAYSEHHLLARSLPAQSCTGALCYLYRPLMVIALFETLSRVRAMKQRRVIGLAKILLFRANAFHGPDRYRCCFAFCGFLFATSLTRTPVCGVP